MTGNEERITSPFGDHLGFEILERSKGLCRVACEVQSHHLNRRGTLHGGVFLSLIDHAAGFADSWTEEGEAPRLSATIDLDCRFTGPVKAGRLIATGRVVSGGRSIYFASTEIHDETGRLVAYGSSSHKRMSSGEKGSHHDNG